MPKQRKPRRVRKPKGRVDSKIRVGPDIVYFGADGSVRIEADVYLGPFKNYVPAEPLQLTLF